MDLQWKQVLRQLKVEVINVLSHPAKGKVERPYQWLQDQIGCKSASQQDTQKVLRAEVHHYNYHPVRSTTGEMSAIQFANARKAGNSLFRPCVVPEPYKSAKEVFCLRATRTVDGVRSIALDRLCIEVA